MLRTIFADAVFCAALFVAYLPWWPVVESLAVLSILQAVAGLELREEFTPIMNSYHAKTVALSAIGGSLFAGKPPLWFADAVLIAAVLFFLFFIAQARNAMAPYDDRHGAATAPSLLPFLTLPIALWLLLKRLFGKPSWFKVSASYYVNIALLAGMAAAILFWAG